MKQVFSFIILLKIESYRVVRKGSSNSGPKVSKSPLKQLISKFSVDKNSKFYYQLTMTRL